MKEATQKGVDLMFILIVLFCYFGALRVSECVNLMKTDVKITPEGLLVKII